MKSIAKTASFWVAFIGLFLASHAKADVIIFDTNNGAGVTNALWNGGTLPINPTFTLTQSTYITKVDIYHYADPTAGNDTISLRDANNVIVSAAVDSIIDYGGCCQHFIATFNQFFGPGIYTILDARSEWWSYNAESGNRGMATVYSGVPPVPTPTPAALWLLALGVPMIVLGRRRTAGPAA